MCIFWKNLHVIVSLRHNKKNISNRIEWCTDNIFFNIVHFINWLQVLSIIGTDVTFEKNKKN